MSVQKNSSLAAVSVALLLVSLTGCSSAETLSGTNDAVVVASATPTPVQSQSPSVTTGPKAPVVDKGLSTDTDMATQLAYLIEEEKLAHDVYTAMYDLWGARVFGNILQSEQSHQSQVLVVMENYKVTDPRKSGLGEFKNQELQKLYDELIAKGSKSAVDAYEVGVAIEELDIKDITDMLATAVKVDVIAMMENLRQGSENHLRAFNRQL